MWCFFFFNDTATTEIYTLSLHDALPISRLLQLDHLLDAGAVELALGGQDVADTQVAAHHRALRCIQRQNCLAVSHAASLRPGRSEEHTSELQSQSNLVCRLLLETKKTRKTGATVRRDVGTRRARRRIRPGATASSLKL